VNGEVAQRGGWASVAGVVGSILIVAFLAWAIHRYTRPAPLGEDRAAVRSKALAELRAAETRDLNNPGYIDPAKGLVRLRIQDAMKIVEQEWGRNPSAARSNLITRVEKATAAPPKAPQKPSEFE
jgi:hypothetical protein